MTSTPELQRVYGKLFDLEWTPEDGREVKIKLDRKVALYTGNIQIVGDEQTVSVDAEGDWEAELVDTDGMSDNAHYIFDINGRIYKKFVPVNAHGWDFHDLPSALGAV